MTTPSRGSLSKKQEAERGIETSDDIHLEFGAFRHPFDFAPVLAQTGSRAKSSNPPDEPGKAPEVTCAGVAVFSAGGGPEVHVRRRGMLDQRNPLAPSTNVTACDCS